MADHTSWITAHDGKWGHIARHHGTCSDDRALSDPAALKHERSLAHPGPILYHREVDRRRPVGAHGLTEIVGSAVLLKEHAVWTDNYAIPESGPVDSASRADTRSVSHIQMATVGKKGARSDVDLLAGARDESPTQEGAEAGGELTSWKA